jgi:hypothetical protein
MTAEWAWATGLFEGEGCIHVWPKRNGGVLIVRMTDLDILQRFADIAACGIIRGPLAVAQPHHKPSYEWRVSRWPDTVRVLQAMYPLLGVRRRAKADELFAQPVGLGGRKEQTHCKRNHPLAGPGSDVHVYRRPDGKSVRICRTCNRERKAA